MFFLVTILTFGQEPKWMPDKKGTYRLENCLPEKSYKLTNGSLDATDNKTFRNNVAAVTEWFHQNHKMLKTPIGFDVRAINNWVWSDYTTKTEWMYGIPARVDFLFELFDAYGSKWTTEPPQYGFEINADWGGIDGFYFTPESIVDDGSRYDLSKSQQVNNALTELQKYFRVYKLVEQPCAGVDIYEAYPDGRHQNGIRTIVVYHADHQPYWLPVTVSEMADAHLAYYSLIQKKEIDRMILEELKKEIAELSPEELSSPAYAGHESHFVFKVNGKRQGYQIMRFNPAYWDKSLPQSAVQFITFRNANHSQTEMDEQANRSYPDYPQIFVNQLNWCEIVKLLNK